MALGQQESDEGRLRTDLDVCHFERRCADGFVAGGHALADLCAKGLQAFVVAKHFEAVVGEHAALGGGGVDALSAAHDGGHEYADGLADAEFAEGFAAPCAAFGQYDFGEVDVVLGEGGGILGPAGSQAALAQLHVVAEGEFDAAADALDDECDGVRHADVFYAEQEHGGHGQEHVPLPGHGDEVGVETVDDDADQHEAHEERDQVEAVVAL